MSKPVNHRDADGPGRRILNLPAIDWLRFRPRSGRSKSGSKTLVALAD